MRFKVVNKRLIYIDEGYNITKGENNNELITIDMPRYPNGSDTDYLSLSHRLTVTSVEDSTIAACAILIKKELKNNKIRLSCPVTQDIASVGKEAFFKVTSVGSNDFIDITECAAPIKINGNSDGDRFPSDTDIEKIVAYAQLAAQKADDAAKNANKSAEMTNDAIQKTDAAAQKAENAFENVTKLINGSHFSPASEANVGYVMVDGDTITSNSDGVISTSENIPSKSDVTAIVQFAVNEIKSYIGYTDGDIIGFHADFENSIFTRLGAAVGLNGGSDFDKFPMYGGRRRCNVLDNGKITAYYGDSSFTEDGSNGQVMVYQPKFYYKVVPLKLEQITDGCGYHLRSANYFISGTPKAGFKLHPAFYDESGNPVDYILFSAYEGSIFDSSENAYIENDEQIADFSADKLSSIAGVKPCSGSLQNLTRANAELLAKNRGKGWHNDTIKAISANQMLIAIEYAGFKTQTDIGLGVVFNNTGNNISTGETSLFGNKTSTPADCTGNNSISYRGMENLWGNMWIPANGINIYVDTNGNAAGYICEDYNFSECKGTDNYKEIDFKLSNSDGYISAFVYSSQYDWLFMASETNDDESLSIGDFYWGQKYQPNQWGTANFGGGGAYDLRAGGYCWSLWDVVDFHRWDIGTRLIYVPNLKDV